MVHLALVPLKLEGRDLEISFRYRHLQQGCLIWFFVDGDDGFGSIDHLLRIKLLTTGVQLQIDSHSLTSLHPERQNKDQPADKASGAFRLSKKLPRHLVELKTNQWHDIKLVFHQDNVTISVDDETWGHTLQHACFNMTKRKLLWLQKSGNKGLEIDDIRIRNATN
ncbi:hypothetical protein N9276_00850 [Rhodopirellula sp.]|nr:hypothetical protein [Rhodopirellula sp.]